MFGPEIAANLVERIAQDRDRRAFADLFAYYAPRIKAYLRRLGADDTLCEELAQEAMLTVWRRAHLFDRRQAGVGTWIFTIARNKRIDAIRRDRRPEIDPNDPALVPEPEPSADKAVENDQRGARLHDAIAVLPEEQAKLLRLSYYDEKSHSAIAEELNLPLGTVKSRIRLALGKLQVMIDR